MKKIFLLLFILNSSLSFSQTCIIAIKTKNKIFVGADSRIYLPRIDIQTGARLDEFRDTICKINIGKNINFAISGYPGAKLIQMAYTLLNDSISFSKFIDDYQKLSESIIINSYNSDKRYIGPFIDSIFKMSNVVTEIIVFGRENDSLKLIKKSLGVFSDKNKRPILRWFEQVPIGRLHDDTLASGDVQEIYSNKILFDKKTWINGEKKESNV